MMSLRGTRCDSEEVLSIIKRTKNPLLYKISMGICPDQTNFLKFCSNHSDANLYVDILEDIIREMELNLHKDLLFIYPPTF